MSNEKRERRYLDPEAARHVLGVGRNTIYQLFHAEGFPAVRIGKRLLVRQDLLDGWLESQSEFPKECGGR